MKELIKLFKALSDKNRLRILHMLTIKEMCVCEITEVLELSASTASKHLSILKDAEIIASRKDGKWVNYRINYMSDDSIDIIIDIVIRKLLKDDIIRKDSEIAKSTDRNQICSIY